MANRMSLLRNDHRGPGGNYSTMFHQDVGRHFQQVYQELLDHFGPDYRRIQAILSQPTPETAYQELESIEGSLTDDIEYLMRSPGYHDTDDVRYLLDIRMERDRQGNWNPRLRILCGTEELRTYLEANLDAYSTVIRRLRLPPAFELFRLAADQRSSLLSSNSARRETDSVLGSVLYIDDASHSKPQKRWRVTIGGVVLVDDIPYGLTAGHYKLFPPKSSDEEGDYWGFAQETRTFFGEVFKESFGSHDSYGVASDWALIKMHRSLSIANRLSIPSHGQMPDQTGDVDEVSSPTRVGFHTEGKDKTVDKTCLIDGSMDMQNFVGLGGNESRRQCVIATHWGLFPAFVEVGTFTMVVHGETFEVLRIEMERALPAGCSGSWVIVDNQILGTVIATQQATELPQAFALPIDATFLSIKKTMNATRVELPSSIETRIFEIERAPLVSRWSEPATLELDLLYAMKQSKKTLRDVSPSFKTRSTDSGWVGLRRAEILQPMTSFSDSIVDASLKVRTYEHLTGLKMDTIRFLIKLGHIFPVSQDFRVQLQSWVAGHKVSQIRGPRAIAVRVIVEECSGTEAGENILGLICTLKLLLQMGGKYTDSRSIQREKERKRAAWVPILLGEIFKALELPPAQRPSEPQVQAFVSHCFLGLKGVPEFPVNDPSQPLQLPSSANPANPASRKMASPEPSDFRREDHLPKVKDHSGDSLFSANFIARMILQLSDVARSGGERVLVCSGHPWTTWARVMAQALGIRSHVRLYGAGGVFESTETKDASPSVCIVMNTNVAVSEVLNRGELPSLGTDIFGNISKGKINSPGGSLATRRKEKRMSRGYDWRQRRSINPMSSPVIEFQDWELLRAKEPS